MTEIENQSFAWIVREIAAGRPKRYLIETGVGAAVYTAGAVAVSFTKAGRRSLIVPGLEKQRHFPMGYCSEETAEWCVKTFPLEYRIANDWEIAEAEKILGLV